MPWTEITRPNYDRRNQRYANDGSDEEWAVVVPFMPPRCKVGRPRRTNMRVMGCDPIHRCDGLPVGDAAERLPTLHAVQYFI
jgi:transposase